MGLARVLAFMTIESIARLLTDGTRMRTREIRVISQAHRVNTANTVESGFELRESLAVGPAHMLAGVFERVSQRARKAGALTVYQLARSFIQLLALDVNTAGPVFILSNAHYKPAHPG